MKAILITLFITFYLQSGGVLASCDIEEIIEYVNDDYSRKEIKSECNRKVDDSECSLSKIVRYAQKGKSDGYILRKCEISSNDDDDDWEGEEVCEGWDCPDQRGGRYRNQQTPQRQYQQIPQQQFRQMPASACYTQMGTCRMAVQIPVGSSCHCRFPMGMAPGIAQ